MFNDEPPREGTRGGLEQFRWDSIKELSMKDRECYLGQSLRIGMLGKFGQYNKHDWWIKNRNLDLEKEEKTQLKSFETEMREEALGLRPKQLLLSKTEKAEMGDAGFKYKSPEEETKTEITALMKEYMSLKEQYRTLRAEEKAKKAGRQRRHRGRGEASSSESSSISGGLEERFRQQMDVKSAHRAERRTSPRESPHSPCDISDSRRTSRDCYSRRGSGEIRDGKDPRRVARVASPTRRRSPSSSRNYPWKSEEGRLRRSRSVSDRNHAVEGRQPANSGNVERVSPRRHSPWKDSSRKVSPPPRKWPERGASPQRRPGGRRSSYIDDHARGRSPHFRTSPDKDYRQQEGRRPSSMQRRRSSSNSSLRPRKRSRRRSGSRDSPRRQAESADSHRARGPPRREPPQERRESSSPPAPRGIRERSWERTVSRGRPLSPLPILGQTDTRGPRRITAAGGRLGYSRPGRRRSPTPPERQSRRFAAKSSSRESSKALPSKSRRRQSLRRDSSSEPSANSVRRRRRRFRSSASRSPLLTSEEE